MGNYKNIKKEASGEPVVEVKVGRLTRTQDPMEVDVSEEKSTSPVTPKEPKGSSNPNFALSTASGKKVFPLEAYPDVQADDFRTGEVAPNVQRGQYSTAFRPGNSPNINSIPGEELPEDEKAAEDKKKALTLMLRESMRAQ